MNKWELRTANIGPLGQRLAQLRTVWRVENAKGEGPYQSARKMMAPDVNDQGMQLESFNNLMYEIDNYQFDTPWTESDASKYLNLDSTSPDASDAYTRHPLPSADFHDAQQVKHLAPAPWSWGTNTIDEETRGETAWYDWQDRINNWIEQEGYKFGFPTRAMAIEWFGPYLEKLSEYGFNLVEVPANEVIVSDSGRQCIYR